MKSVKVVKAHKNYDEQWMLEDGNALTSAAGFVIENYVDDWPDVAIAYADYPFPDNVSKLVFDKTFMSNKQLVYSYKYDIKVGRKSKQLKVFFGEDLLKYLPTKLPDNIYFKIFKI
jgi:hypothetical protein